MRHLPRVYVPALALMLCCMVGCGASQSYKLAVGKFYPVVATRIDGLMPNTPAATGLREAAKPPVTFPTASAAWRSAAPVYRTLVSGAPTLSDHRRADWIETARLLDELNAAEARHRNPFLFAPQPTTLPSPTN